MTRPPPTPVPRNPPRPPPPRRPRSRWRARRATRGTRRGGPASRRRIRRRRRRKTRRGVRGGTSPAEQRVEDVGGDGDELGDRRGAPRRVGAPRREDDVAGFVRIAGGCGCRCRCRCRRRRLVGGAEVEVAGGVGVGVDEGSRALDQSIPERRAGGEGLRGEVHLAPVLERAAIGPRAGDAEAAVGLGGEGEDEAPVGEERGDVVAVDPAVNAHRAEPGALALGRPRADVAREERLVQEVRQGQLGDDVRADARPVDVGVETERARDVRQGTRARGSAGDQNLNRRRERALGEGVGVRRLRVVERARLSAEGPHRETSGEKSARRDASGGGGRRTPREPARGAARIVKRAGRGRRRRKKRTLRVYCM